MKSYRIALVALLALSFAPSRASAQQTPAPDLQAAIYSQLLSESNGRLVMAGAQVQQLQAMVADLQKQLAAAKSAQPKVEPPSDPVKTP